MMSKTFDRLLPKINELCCPSLYAFVLRIYNVILFKALKTHHVNQFILHVTVCMVNCEFKLTINYLEIVLGQKNIEMKGVHSCLEIEYYSLL